MDGPAHGYDIARAVERTTNGCCSPSRGALYPTLREFEPGGYVTSETEVVSGRERRVYTLTDKGPHQSPHFVLARLGAKKSALETA